MLVTNHVLSGALLAHVVRRPATAFAAGVVSHAVLDATPHWGDPRPMRELLHVAVPDGLIGLAVMGLVTARTPADRRLAVLAGMSGAAFPDIDKPSLLFFGVSPFPAAIDAFHGWIQRESPRRMPQELLVGLSAAAALALLTRRDRRGVARSR